MLYVWYILKYVLLDSVLVMGFSRITHQQSLFAFHLEIFLCYLFFYTFVSVESTNPILKLTKWHGLKEHSAPKVELEA